MGRKINIDENEFLNYLSYLKDKGFEIEITTALMERVRTKIDLRILSEMIISFVKLDNIKDMKNIYLTENDYLRIKQIHDMALAQVNENLEQFNIICCCIMKAYLINVAWDIYHISLVEQIMLIKNMKNTEQVILSYY